MELISFLRRFMFVRLIAFSPIPKLMHGLINWMMAPKAKKNWQHGPLDERAMKAFVGGLGKSSTSGSFGEIFFLKRRNMVVKRIENEDIGQYHVERDTFTTLKSHPNIIQMFGSIEIRGCGYIFMEICPFNLTETIQRNQLKFQDVISIAIGTASGIQHMHGFCIAHCDLKPDNIMLTEDNQVKLIDFGGATEFQKTPPVQTKGYLQPGEDVEATPERDVYAYGTVLLQLLRCNTALQVPGEGGDISLQRFALDTDDWKSIVAGRFLSEENHEKAEIVVGLAKECIKIDPQSRPLLGKVLETLGSL